jgi:tetratricopeptide (TPR) repeat protein
MAERIEEAEAEGASEAGIGPVSPAAAMAIGMHKGRGGSKPDPEFDGFLRDQRRLINLQTEHLHEQRELMLSRLRLGRWKDRITLALQAMTAVVGLAIAAAVGVMAWQAHEDHGVSIAAFSVPPDFAGRGLTGQVLASEVLDRLSDLQAATVTARPASSYANDWGGDIKVEIPDTGVSIGELNRWLRDWLGSGTRITGEVVRTPTGIAVTARAGEATGQRFEGAQGDIDKLVAQAAEAIYAQTQPYRYALWQSSHGHEAEALVQFQWLARHGPGQDQPWAYSGWSSALQQRGDFEGGANVVREGLRRGLQLYDSGALNNLSISENALTRFDALASARRVEEELERTGRGFGTLSRDAALENIKGAMASRLGDYRTVIELWGRDPGFNLEGRTVNVRTLLGRDLVADHDVTAGLRLSDPTSEGLLNFSGLNYGLYSDRMKAALALRDWPEVVAMGEKDFALAAPDPRTRQFAFREEAAILAIGYARVGRLVDARAMLTKTLLDCESCLEARAWVAELAGDHAGADRWFAEFERADPEIPFPAAEWGKALLERGDLDGAIARSTQAHRKGPHYAEPMQTWGEALMARRDQAAAVQKFSEADKDAPRWGRNHMLWGEALMLSGRYREARAQFEAANGMDLSGADRAALSVLLTRTASGPLHG